MSDRDHEMSSPVDDAPPNMEVDVSGESCRKKPYFGTKRYFNNIVATVANPKTLKDLFDEYK